jgi:hypothetical protein
VAPDGYPNAPRPRLSENSGFGVRNERNVHFVHLPGVDAWRANATTGWGLVVRITRWVEPVVLWTLVLTLGATLTGLVTRDRP